jgi:FkbM family methyltransferase
MSVEQRPISVSRLGAHLRWRRKLWRADAADRSGRPFRYPHPLAGRFIYHPGDYLSRRIFLYDDFERTELAFAVEHARRGGTILDVGANIGLYTAACARAAAPAGRVVAIEPGPATFEKLARTCALIGLPNVTLLQLAAGRADGSGVLVCPDGGRDVHQHLADARAHAPGEAVRVDVRRLDGVCRDAGDAITLMKLDVEGHEVAALEGAESILRSGRTHLIVEFCRPNLAATGASVEQLWALLERTHTCVGVVSPEGAMCPPRPGSVAGDSACNTLWSPRPRAGRAEGRGHGSAQAG